VAAIGRGTVTAVVDLGEVLGALPVAADEFALDEPFVRLPSAPAQIR